MPDKTDPPKTPPQIRDEENNEGELGTILHFIFYIISIL